MIRSQAAHSSSTISAVTYKCVLTKADDVKPRALAAKRDEVAGLLAKHPAAYPQIIATSSNTGAGIDELRGSIAALTD